MVGTPTPDPQLMTNPIALLPILQQAMTQNLQQNQQHAATQQALIAAQSAHTAALEHLAGAINRLAEALERHGTAGLS